jgi:hypothetical protein
MRVEKITFSLTRTMPLFPITRNPADEYANIKPFASVTIEFDDEDTKVEAKELINEAFDRASDIALKQIAAFAADFKSYYDNQKSLAQGSKTT